MPQTTAKTRLAFGLLAYAFAAIMVGTTLPTPMYALYADHMHFAVLTTTVIYATYAGGVLFALLAFGRWSDAIGRRPVLLAGVVFAVASAAVFLVADSVPMLLVGRVLSGLSAGLFTGPPPPPSSRPPRRTGAPGPPRSRRSRIWAGWASGRCWQDLLVQYAPAPLHLSFIVHIVLAVLAGIAVLVVPETSQRTGRIGVQRLSVPVEVRAVFVIASLAAFAGFAVTGLFAAVAPSFLSQVVGIDNHAVAGLIASSIFFASAVAQIAAGNLNPQRAVAIGCAILVAGMVILAVALHLSSLSGSSPPRWWRASDRASASAADWPPSPNARPPTAAPRSAPPISSSPTWRSRCRWSARALRPSSGDCKRPV